MNARLKRDKLRSRNESPSSDRLEMYIEIILMKLEIKKHLLFTSGYREEKRKSFFLVRPSAGPVYRPTEGRRPVLRLHGRTNTHGMRIRDERIVKRHVFALTPRDGSIVTYRAPHSLSAIKNKIFSATPKLPEVSIR